MLKKIALGIVMAGVSGGLIYGAVNRTVLRAETSAGSGGISGARGNQGRLVEEDDQTTGLQNRGNRNGGSGQGRNNADEPFANPTGSGLAQVDAVYEITGIVSLVDEDQMIVLDETGSQTLVENRAWWYALDAGFTAAAGDTLQLTGFYDEGVFETISLENVTQSITVQIREESGRPLWAGGGRN
jgi:hypothetical protein